MKPEQLAVQIIQRSIWRFIKVFISSGIAATLLIPPVVGLHYGDVKSYLSAFCIAFVSGGILGVEKLLSQVYVAETNPAQAQVPVVEQVLTPTNPVETQVSSEIIPPEN